MTEASLQVLQVLRSPENLQWHVVPLIALFWAVGAVFVEVLLNKGGLLVWEYTHWQWPNVYFMIIWWAVPYYILLWLHDNLSVEAKGRLAAASVVFAAGCHLLFAVVLGWV